MNEEDEEEKEVDPSLVGSLDNVYTEAPGTMPGEDPFKRVPMILDNEKPSNLMEMEKTLEAMEASMDRESSQELDSSDDMSSLDVGGLSRRPRAQQAATFDPSDRVEEGAADHRTLNQIRRLPSDVGGGAAPVAGATASMMPDLLTGGPPATPPDIQLSSQLAPDVMSPSRSPVAPGSRPAAGLLGGGGEGGGGGAVVDLLHNTSSAADASQGSRSGATQPVDLTDGLLGLRVGSGEGET